MGVGSVWSVPVEPRLARLLGPGAMRSGGMSYDWMAALVFVGTLILLTVVGKFLVFKIPGIFHYIAYA